MPRSLQSTPCALDYQAGAELYRTFEYHSKVVVAFEGFTEAPVRWSGIVTSEALATAKGDLE